jgi:Tfp pilus assembly protein PilV
VTKRRHRGASLLEVLVTFVVISAGLLSYVAAQRGIFHEASLSTGRITATELALAKLEDLRSYTALPTTAGVAFAFQQITSGAGGVQPSGDVTINATTFHRSWTVVDHWYTTPNAATTTTAPAGNPLPSFKLVTVTIAWTDQSGNANSLALPSIIAASEPRRAGTVFN